MKNSKGYTLVELMVGMIILLLAIAGALSFFILQSQEGFESFRTKRIDEMVFLAQAVISRDIMEAGFGLAEHPELSMFTVNEDQTNTYASYGGASKQVKPDALYVSYNQYLTMDTVPDVKDATVLTSLRGKTVFYDSLASTYQGYVSLASSSQLQLQCVPRREGVTINNAIGAIITNGSPAISDVRINQSSATDCASPPKTQTWTFPLASAVPTGTIVAPAISYKWRKITVGSEQIGCLWRNRGSDTDPYGRPFLGGETYVDVTDFQVDLNFTDQSWASVFSGSASDTQGQSNLRLVRVTMSYRTRPKGTAQWGPVHVRTITASPRNLVIEQ